MSSLKNNRLTAASTTAVDSIIRMRKYLGNIAKTMEPLRVSLDDIRNVETRGKWWLVGAAWRGSNEGTEKDADVDFALLNDMLDTAEPDWLALAREQRMNTTVRSAVFVALMGAEDYIDAYNRLMKLKLRKVQEREIPRVILHCCGNEESFNPFYAYVAGALCKQHSIKMTFQFGLWDFFKEIDKSLKDDSDEDGEENFLQDDYDERFHGDDAQNSNSPTKTSNLAKFYGLLVADGHMTLNLLKNVNFLTCTGEMNKFIAFFFRQIFQHVWNSKRKEKKTNERENALSQIVLQVKGNYILLKGLVFFLKTRLRDIDLGEKTKQKSQTSADWGADLVCDVAERVGRSD